MGSLPVLVVFYRKYARAYRAKPIVWRIIYESGHFKTRVLFLPTIFSHNSFSFLFFSFCALSFFLFCYSLYFLFFFFFLVPSAYRATLHLNLGSEGGQREVQHGDELVILAALTLLKLCTLYATGAYLTQGHSLFFIFI